MNPPTIKETSLAIETAPGKRAILITFAAFGLLLSGCSKAVIKRFDVLPIVGCPDTETSVDWDVDGRASVEIDTTYQGHGQAADTLVYTLTVKKCRSQATDRRVIARFPGQFEDLVIFEADKNATGDSLVAGDEKNPERWDEKFAIETVSSGSDRILVVTHEGQTVTLPADGSPSSILAGLRIGGWWRLSSALLPAETSGNVVPPPSLRVRLTALCRK